MCVGAFGCYRLIAHACSPPSLLPCVPPSIVLANPLFFLLPNIYIFFNNHLLSVISVIVGVLPVWSLPPTVIASSAVRIVYTLAVIGALDRPNNFTTDNDVTSPQHRSETD